ncbi:MAG TPA: DNA methyltransferase [Armatimonadota bacterium]|jgi:SAM-dependent methyltransferase
MSKHHPRNQMNDLTGTEWIKFTRTWFVCDSPRYHRNRNTELHPARFPEELAAEFLRYFTRQGGWVLDPFAGSGATLVASAEEGRCGVGVELSERYAGICRQRLEMATAQTVLCGDAREITVPTFWDAARAGLEEAGLPFNAGLPAFDFSISSPPYGAMLHTSRGGVYSKQKQRATQGLDTAYSADDPRDLGNIADHPAFVAELGRIYRGVARLLKPDGYLTIVVQNYRAPGGGVVPLAWDLARELSADLLFQGERIWCQNTKPLGIWGYPKSFVPNYHHHYCLIFRNRQP